MPVPRAFVNQVVQIGVEATPGTAVPANRVLTAFTWSGGLKPATKQFRGSGRQYPSASALLTEQSAGKLTGPLDFAQSIYPCAGLFGAPTFTLHPGGAVLANDAKFTPPIIGSYAAVAKTLTMQQGDASDAEQYAFLAFSGWGYSFTRKQEATNEADWMSQTFTDGITLTASPTVVQQLTSTGAQFNVYLDGTSAGIGVTQLVDFLKADFKASDYYDGYWPVNRANASYTNIIDKEKKNELSIIIQANSTGIAVKGSYLEVGTRAYVRVSGVGQVIEVDQLVGVGGATAGTFTLTYKGQTTAGIAFNATAAAVASALQLLSTIGANGCVVSGTAPSWTVRMTGALAADTTAMTGSGTGLTGGTFSISTPVTNAAMTHDMAVFVAEQTEFSNQDEVFAVGYKLVVAEDAAWGANGTAQLLTYTSLLSSL